MPDHVHMLISIPPKYSVAEVIGYLKGKALSGPQILGEGLLRFDRREGRGDDPRLYQKSGDGGQAVGSDAIQARVLMKSRLLYQNP